MKYEKNTLKRPKKYDILSSDEKKTPEGQRNYTTEGQSF